MGQGLGLYNNIPVDANAMGVFSEMATKENFIATKVLPQNPALDPYRGDIYSLSSVTDQLDDKPTSARERGREIEVKENKISYVTTPYKITTFCDPDKAKAKVDPARARLMDRQNGVAIVTKNRATLMEKKAADTFFNTSNFSGSNPATQWSTTASAKPIKDLNALAYAIGVATGIAPNAIIFGHKPWRDFASNETLLNTRSVLKDQVLTQAQAIDLIRTGELENISNIFVGRGSYTSSNINAGTLVRTSLWGNFVWIGYIDFAPNADTLLSATVARYEESTNSMGQTQMVAIREFIEEDKDPDALYIEGKVEFAYKTLDANLGRLLTNVSA